MPIDHDESRRKRAPRRPLDETSLRDLALAYVARFATSAARLESYLVRKLRERGWQGREEPDTAAIVERMVDLGYIDDAQFAQLRARALLGRGYGPRRVAQALRQAGIEEADRNGARVGESASRQAALLFARKRRFGPFGGAKPDRVRRDKQLAAMMRAGHAFDHARAVIDAEDEQAAEGWGIAMDEDERNAT